MNDTVQISVTLAGLVVFIRECAWFIRSMRGQTPNAELKEAFKELTNTLKEMNGKLDSTKHIVERTFDKVQDLRERI